MPEHQPMIIIIDSDQASHYQHLAADYSAKHVAAYNPQAGYQEANDAWEERMLAAGYLTFAVEHLIHGPASTLSPHETGHGWPCPLSGAIIDSSAGPSTPGSPCPNGCETAVIVRPDSPEEPVP